MLRFEREPRKETNPTSGSKPYRQEPLKQGDLPSLLLLHRQVECLRRGLLPTAKVWGREKLFKGADVFSGKSCIRSLLSCSTTAGGPAVRAVVVPHCLARCENQTTAGRDVDHMASEVFV